MEKIKFYYVGKNIINIVGGIVLVNGTRAAVSFVDFVAWFKNNGLNVEQFRNWPFEEGISEPLHRPTINRRRRK